MSEDTVLVQQFKEAIQMWKHILEMQLKLSQTQAILDTFEAMSQFGDSQLLVRSLNIGIMQLLALSVCPLSRLPKTDRRLVFRRC